MAIEYIGELLSDDHLSVAPEVFSRFSKDEPPYTLFELTHSSEIYFSTS